MSPRPSQFALLLLLSAVLNGSADDFPAIYNSEKDKSSKLMSAKEAAASFQLPEGFEVSVFASEPDVQNPIAMTWDHRGRLWIAENYTYAERQQRFDLSLRDRVLIFEDSDWDGKADKRTVFTDDVQMLTSVEVGRGGVWLMCPPQLLFVPDRNGDDQPDGEPQVVLDGFTVAKGNYHNFANGLRWGPDGWLYGRCGHSCPGMLGIPGTSDEDRVPIDGGIWRYHPNKKTVEVLTHGTTNPWGHDWDKHGEMFFINTVNGHLWHMIPGAHFKESFGFSQNPHVYERLDMHADHWHFDTKGSWTKSRDGKANDFGGGHAHIGMMIYQGDHLPAKYRGRLFTWNMHGRRANVERLERHGSGYIGRHEPDVFLSGDTWFRGIDLQTGPDGAIYAIDWSDTGECHEHTGVHRESGRIYRISQGKPPKPEFSGLQNLDADYLLGILDDSNDWFVRQSRIQVADLSGPDGLVPGLLQAISTQSHTSEHRLRALWMLHNLGNTDQQFLLSLLDDPDEHLRVWAIRLLTEAWPIDSIHGPRNFGSTRSPEIMDALASLSSDPSPLVRLALASTLQRLPLSARIPIAAELTSDRKLGSDDHNLSSIVWYSLCPIAAAEPERLAHFIALTTWPDLIRWSSRALASEAIDGASYLANPLSEITNSPEKAASMLEGMVQGFRGIQKAPRPAHWDNVAAKFGQLEDTAELVDRLNKVFGEGLNLDELHEIVSDAEADMQTRRTALETIILSSTPEVVGICEKLLSTRFLNSTAVKGLAHFDDPAIGTKIITNYNKFHSSERSSAIETLVTRPAWADQLLEAVAKGKIPREDITPFHARQIESLGEKSVSTRLTEVWGDIRTSSKAKQQRIAELKTKLTPSVLADADLTAGRAHYQILCASCHILYGEGGRLGPDLTGSGRSNLDYLLENIVAPSAVVSADFQVSYLKLKDGRSLGGVVAGEDKRVLTLRLLTEEMIIPQSEIDSREKAAVSMMPEGLLDTLKPDQVRDLLGYLMHPRQVAIESTR